MRTALDLVMRFAKYRRSICSWKCIVFVVLLHDLLTAHQCDAQGCANNQFMDNNTGSAICKDCTDCGIDRLETVSKCNATADAVCRPCADPNKFYNDALGTCSLNCSVCPSTKCANGMEFTCYCDDPCKKGVLCDELKDDDPECVAVTTTTTNPSTPTTPSEPINPVFPPWGIAIVAVGVITGIVMFSALFVLLGLATSRRRGSRHVGINTSGSSSHSTNSTLMADKLSYSTGRSSASIVSLYTHSNSPVLLNYQLSLAALKHSTPVGGSWNHIKNSPKTRCSSVPVTIANKPGYLTPV